MKQIIKEINKFSNIEIDEHYEIVIIRDYDYDKLNNVRRMCHKKDICCDLDTMYQELKLLIFF